MGGKLTVFEEAWKVAAKLDPVTLEH